MSLWPKPAPLPPIKEPYTAKQTIKKMKRELKRKGIIDSDFLKVHDSVRVTSYHHHHRRESFSHSRCVT